MSDVQPPQYPSVPGGPAAHGQPAPERSAGVPGSWGQATGQPGEPGQQGQPQQPGRAPGKPAPGTDLGGDLGASLTYGWQGFARNLGAFLVPAIVYSVLIFLLITVAVIIGVILALPQLQADIATGNEDVPWSAVLAIYAPMVIAIPITAVIGILWTSGAYRASAVIADGGRPTIGQGFIGTKNVILTMLLVGLITTIGFLLLYIPGLILSVLLMYAGPAAARGAWPGEALKQSFSMVRDHLGASIVLMLVLGAVGSVAGTLVIPTIALVPFTALAIFGMFDRLRGHELVDPARHV